VVSPVSSSSVRPGGGVVEVEAAGGVEGVLAGADGETGEEDCLRPSHVPVLT
jgi:hypothetical protein